MTEVVGRVVGLWRYPVKSMQGEHVSTLVVDRDGPAGDRIHAVYDPVADAFASAKTIRRYGALLHCAARLDADGELTITLPDGSVVTGEEIDVALSALAGSAVRLASWRERHPRWYTFHGADRRDVDPGRRDATRFHDSFRVHLLSTATLSGLGDVAPEDVRRFRPNVVVQTERGGYPEEAWIGRTLALGSVQLHVDRACPRCVMPTLPQAGGVDRDPGVRRRLLERNGDNAGVLADVVTAGAIAVGDEIVLG